MSLKDGMAWGLGHTSTILLIGALIIVFKTSIPPLYFQYFEAIVGGMLVILGVYRLAKYFRTKKVLIHTHPHSHAGESHGHFHLLVGNNSNHQHTHSLAYGVGLVHGLAGSGAIVLLAMFQVKGSMEGMLYLLIFGLGCIVGMMLAAGLFSIPFSKKILQAKQLQVFLIVASSVLYILFGSKVIVENLFL